MGKGHLGAHTYLERLGKGDIAIKHLIDSQEQKQANSWAPPGEHSKKHVRGLVHSELQSYTTRAEPCSGSCIDATEQMGPGEDHTLRGERQTNKNKNKNKTKKEQLGNILDSTDHMVSIAMIILLL